MKFILVLSLIALPAFGGEVLLTSSVSEGTGLDAKNPGCDPEIHVCSEEISG